MLDELGEDVDTTHSRLRATQKKVGVTGRASPAPAAASAAAPADAPRTRSPNAARNAPGTKTPPPQNRRSWM
jgi:hypothetical protein